MALHGMKARYFYIFKLTALTSPVIRFIMLGASAVVTLNIRFIMLGALAMVTLKDSVQICLKKKYRFLVYDTFSRKIVDIINVTDLNGRPAPTSQPMLQL